MSKHTPMAVKAARELCRRVSDACMVNEADNWAIYGDEHIADAEAALDAAGVPALLEALQKIATMDCGNPYARACAETARAAIATATQEAGHAPR